VDGERYKREYISVGELSVGFSENVLPSTKVPAGKKVELRYESGKRAIITFTDGEALEWETEEQGRKKRCICSYRAILPRPDIYFTDFIVSGGDTKSVSILVMITDTNDVVKIHFL
jgi:hypothetical protein